MLSEHFSREEFACKCCGTLPLNGISKALLEGLERLRVAIGNRPINVSSGYRCRARNFEVGGVPNSDHILGVAADICVEDMDVDELGSECKKIFDGVGIYRYENFVHVDMRSDGKEVGEYTWYK